MKYFGGFPEIEENCKIYLNEDKTSCIMFDQIPEELSTNDIFQEIWNIKPNTRPILTIYDKKYKTPRFVQTYDRTYNYSNIEQEALDISEILELFLNSGNEWLVENEIDYLKFNQILVNWYEDGNRHIGRHSDDETQFNKNKNDETFIYSITFTDEDTEGLNRIFRLKPI